MATFGNSKDLQALGNQKALATLGFQAPAPKLKPRKEHEYTTSGAYVNPKVAVAPIEAPGYKLCGVKKTSCSTCAHFKRHDALMGLCKKYDFHSRQDFVCKSWR